MEPLIHILRDRCVTIVEKWQVPEYTRLHAGEIGKQEMRTLQAVLSAIRREIERLE